MARVVTLSDYRESNEAAPDSWIQRTCPNYRPCWPFSWESFRLDIEQHDRVLLIRRLSMWATLTARVIFNFLSVRRALFSLSVGDFVFRLIISLIDFFFIAQCLAKIGDAVGRRKVAGMMVVSRLLQLNAMA